MITYHADTGELSITDLGRIAADYYVSTKSIELFNQKFRPVMSEADMLAMLSESTEVSCYGVETVYQSD
jgi:antiviral helicase SLH1